MRGQIATTEIRSILLREVGEYSEKINAITAGIVEMKVLKENGMAILYTQHCEKDILLSMHNNFTQ